MPSLESQIMAALQAQLKSLTWAKVVEYEKIKLLQTDFRANELPAIQFYDSGRTFRHLQGRIEATWAITIELVMKRTISDRVDQGILLDRSEAIERAIGDNVELGLNQATPTVGNVVHVKYLNAISDLHTLEPFFISLLNFSVLYYKPYTGTC